MSITQRRRRAGFQYFLGFAGFIIVWWGGSFLVGSAVLPGPGAVGAYLARPGVVGSFFRQVALTAGRGLLGFSLAWLVAVPVGLAMGRRQGGERIGFFPLFLLQSAPPLFWVTPLVLWVGTRGLVPPMVAFLVSLPLLTVHTMMAVKHIPDYEYDVFSVYAPRPMVIARELYVPHLLPALKSNIHLGLLVAIKASMLAEWFAAQDGFGQTIRVHYQFFAMTEFIGWALMFLIVIGGVSFGLRGLLERTLPAYRSTPEAARPKHATSQPATHFGNDQAKAVTVTGLSFGYEDQSVFQELSLAFDSDRPLVLYGRSGCGKTTLLKCITGILKPWQGTISFEGGPGPFAAGPRPHETALVFQQDALLAHRDVLGNVLLPAFPRYGADDVERARRCLALWGLGDKERQFPHELSGGMRKRLAMARAWFFEPSVLLLDEPFVNLDREARAALWDTFMDHLRSTRLATLIVTHYPEELERFGVDIASWDDVAGR